MTPEALLLALKDEETREAAFTQAGTTRKEHLYFHIRRMVISHEDADDVLQKLLLRCLKNIGNFKGENQLFTWMYRIATHQALDHLRKQSQKGNTTPAAAGY